MLGFHPKLISESSLGFYMTFRARMSFAALEDKSYNYTSHTHNSLFFKVLSWVFYLSIIMTLRSKEGRNGFLSSPHRHKRRYVSSPRSPFLVHGREETTDKTVGVLTWYTDVLTPVLCLRGCLTLRKLAFSVKEGVAWGFIARQVAIECPEDHTATLHSWQIFMSFLFI